MRTDSTNRWAMPLPVVVMQGAWMRFPEVEVRDLPAVPLAVVRRTAAPHELARGVLAGCGLVWNFVRAQQLRGGRHVAIYWDAAINLDVGVELAEPFTPGAEVVAGRTPAGPAA